MADTPRSVGIYDPFASNASAASSVFLNALDYGVSVDADDNGPALQALVDLLDAQGATIVLPTPTTNSVYRFRRPIWINRSFVNIQGTGQFGPALGFDLTAYVGALPKHGFIFGDPNSVPSANATIQDNSLASLRVDVTGGNTAIYAQRCCSMDISRIAITGAGLSYGIRQIAGDNWFHIDACSIGLGSAATAPDIGISVENGANQTSITRCSVIARSEAIRTFNSLGLTVLNNRNFGMWVTVGAKTYYGIRIMTDQPVPAWLTWVLAGQTGAATRIKDNWFEPGDLNAAGINLHDIYAGSGAVPVGQHATVDVEAEGNYHFGTQFANRIPYVLENADGAYVRPGYIAGDFTNAVWVKAGATNYVVDAKRTSQFNMALSGAYVRDDAGVGIIIDDFNDNAGAPTFRKLQGNLVLSSGSILLLQNTDASASTLLDNPGGHLATRLRVQTLPDYATNAAALAAGENAGVLYHNTTSDTVNVVHP